MFIRRGQNILVGLKSQNSKFLGVKQEGEIHIKNWTILFIIRAIQFEILGEGSEYKSKNG